MLAACSFIPRCFGPGKYIQRPKGTSLECAESIYVKTTCVSDELCRFQEGGQIVSLGDSRIKRVRDRWDLLNMLTVRVAVLEYSQLHEKAYNMVVCKFGGFENVLRDAGISAIPL